MGGEFGQPTIGTGLASGRSVDPPIVGGPDVDDGEFILEVPAAVFASAVEPVPMGTDDTLGGEGLTLAFSLSAIERLDDPREVFDDARRWSEHVGVVDQDAEAVEAVVESHGVRQDFDLGDRDIWLNMQGILQSTQTPRHVYVGSSAEDRRVATQLGWEFVSVTEAAEKAGWALADGDTEADADHEGGSLARFLRAVRKRLGRS